MTATANGKKLGALFRCISAASFSTPVWVPPESTWLEHAPFGFWLIDALRPRLVVELGTYFGYAFASFCQAVHSLNLDCRCYGIDRWDEDAAPNSKGREIFRALRDHIEAHYRPFASLIRSGVDEAAADFTDESIDLLHIDGCHSYQQALTNFMSWRARLSGSSVVLFHHTNVRQGSHGAARLWRELARDHRHFEFIHGLGLGILGTGKAFPPGIEYLFESAREEQAVSQIRLAYSQLGSIISLRVRCGDPEGHLRQLHMEQAQMSARVAELETELARQSVTHSYLGTIASLREAEVSKRDEIIKDIQNERDAIKIEYHNRIQEIEQLRKDKDSIGAECHVRMQEIERLRKDKEAVAAKNSNTLNQIQELRSGLEQLQKERDTLVAVIALREAEVGRLQTERLSLLNSRSWRITAPLRSVSRTLLHRKTES
jgi:predicted O-methyltransferase YrrM